MKNIFFALSIVIFLSSCDKDKSFSKPDFLNSVNVITKAKNDSILSHYVEYYDNNYLLKVVDKLDPYSKEYNVIYRSNYVYNKENQLSLFYSTSPFLKGRNLSDTLGFKKISYANKKVIKVEMPTRSDAPQPIWGHKVTYTSSGLLNSKIELFDEKDYSGGCLDSTKYFYNNQNELIKWERYCENKPYSRFTITKDSIDNSENFIFYDLDDNGNEKQYNKWSEYKDENGNIISIKYDEGAVTNYIYDKYDNIISVERDKSFNYKTSYLYSNKNQKYKRPKLVDYKDYRTEFEY